MRPRLPHTGAASCPLVTQCQDPFRTIQADRRRVRRICDGRSYPSGHASLARLPRLPHCPDPLWLGPDWGELGVVVERSADRQREMRQGWCCTRAPGCPEDVADQGRSSGQHQAGQALCRTLVRGQALPGDAPARCCGPAAGHPPSEPLKPLPGLLPTREQQQQARRLAEAGAKEVERIKAALEPRKALAETKPRARDARRARVQAGLSSLRHKV
ncbi:hypothetical protein D3C81_315700 [compost metagenome]